MSIRNALVAAVTSVVLVGGGAAVTEANASVTHNTRPATPVSVQHWHPHSPYRDTNWPCNGC